jgi:hypothetical protein
VENLRVHYSKRVKLWVVERADQIELFYLPSSGAELNPEQRLSADLKHATDSKLPARTKTQLKAAATSTCGSFSNHPNASKATSRIRV